MEQHVFDEAAQALRGLLPSELGPVQLKAHRYGLKVWLGPAKPPTEPSRQARRPDDNVSQLTDGEVRRSPPRRSPSEHYEAQVVGARHVPGASVLAIEVGFHAEHADPAANRLTLDALVGHEKRWRKALGPEAVAGPFLDDRHGWRRLSETWADPDLGDPDLGFELAARLTDYITAIEPLRPG